MVDLLKSEPDKTRLRKSFIRIERAVEILNILLPHRMIDLYRFRAYYSRLDRGEVNEQEIVELFKKVFFVFIEAARPYLEDPSLHTPRARVRP